ncbi:MAG: DNA-protecting protein DprA [Syntrophobacterales bacterium CG23_combo_of_CG06-09_8_20_14_all_48_27]|nr:MAG: DNA-protecting protein DprA [Syntrophobacterales bacterium CG23_combo_of_CG06-09_8_20_14_all_48_27]
MKHHNLRYWIALKFVDGVGNVGFKTLVDALGSPQNVFQENINTLRMVPGIGEKTADRIKAFNDWEKVEREMETAHKMNVSIATFQDPQYPKALLNIYDFPPFLYVKGILGENDINVAVVGSRAASTYGKFSTERLCRELAMHGITVVSGMARGIDSAAHRGALAGKGRTIAVLGSGLDVVYPPENEKLFLEIAAHGAVITDFPFSTPPHGPNFPARNRIISGISHGVVVVEAGEKSGSLITARLALEQGREVFAVPGSIDTAGSRGTHKLIKQGAKLIENVYDVLDEILPQLDRELQVKFLQAKNSPQDNAAQEKGTPAAAEVSGLSDAETSVLKQVSSKPVNVDSIIVSTGLKANDVLSILLNMELQGLVRQLPGKIFVRKE